LPTKEGEDSIAAHVEQQKPEGAPDGSRRQKRCPALSAGGSFRLLPIHFL
jgi:hypothetical protein